MQRDDYLSEAECFRSDSVKVRVRLHYNKQPLFNWGTMLYKNATGWIAPVPVTHPKFKKKLNTHPISPQ